MAHRAVWAHVSKLAVTASGIRRTLSGCDVWRNVPPAAESCTEPRAGLVEEKPGGQAARDRAV